MTQSLVTVQEYRDITKDVTTASSAVEEALEESVDTLEFELDRKLRSGEYTETLEVWYGDGASYVYPLATPITALPASATYILDNGARRLRGVTVDSPIVGDWYSGVPAWGDWTGRPLYSTVVYTGGFTHDTLPPPLRRAIARLANSLTTITAQRAALVGASSISVGDVSVTYPQAAGGLDELVPGLSLTLRGFKRRRIRF